MFSATIRIMEDQWTGYMYCSPIQFVVDLFAYSDDFSSCRRKLSIQCSLHCCLSILANMVLKEAILSAGASRLAHAGEHIQ